ncbi:MAG: DUF4276 family protein [Deltaproteobacteria bacterium]|nr:DUF4276 family protein [Deltaproteobacteria bacterium]
MKRILALVEGQTEEGFVREVLAPTLELWISARILGVPGHKGGIRPWDRVRKELISLLREDRDAVVTTCFDYFRLPTSFPGKATIVAADPPAAKAAKLEAAMLDAIALELGESWNRGQLVPYIQMHEFEAVLFSDPVRFASGVGLPGLAASFQRIRGQFESPEHINDGATTAPSKRIEAIVTGYIKPLHGLVGALEIGLPAMRAECSHFAAWVERLEQVGKK